MAILADASNETAETLSPADVERFGADPVASFRAKVAAVHARIAAACASAGRNPAAIRLLPITKTVPSHVLRLAHRAGMANFGENKIQEAQGKQQALADLPIAWSIVGHLQSNKAKQLVAFATEFHALDSLRLAEILDRRLEAVDRTLDVYVQVNTSGEASKYGLAPSELLPFVTALKNFPRLNPRGLMTLAILSPDLARVRPCFRLLRSLRDQVVERDPAFAELSMGMSGDYETAIAEGADVVRVGRAIFGARPTPPGYYWPGVPIEQ